MYLSELEGYIVCCPTCGPVSIHKNNLIEVETYKNIATMTVGGSVSALCSECGYKLSFKVVSLNMEHMQSLKSNY